MCERAARDYRIAGTRYLEAGIRSSVRALQLEASPNIYIIYRAMAKIGYTRKPDGQNRVPPSTLVPGRHLIGQRPPRPDSGRISHGSTRFWLLTPPSATRFQSHLPDYGRAIRPAAHTRTRTRRRVIASSRDAAGHFCGRRGRVCGRTLTF